MYLFRNCLNSQAKAKVCGLARKADIDDCIRLKVDALGFLLGDAKGRYPTDKLTVDEAADLVNYVNRRTKSVLLVKSINAQEITELLKFIKPDVVQLQHEALNPTVLADLKEYFPSIEWIKTVKIQPDEQAILLDSYKPGAGVSPDWVQCKIVAEYMKSQSIPYVLAGGLNPLNVTEALRYFESFTPRMVDVMSGVSTGRGTGIKDISAVAKFVAAVHQFNS